MSAKRVIIVGGGISGLSALHFLRRMRPEYDVTLYESEKRLGGTIGTDKIDGYSFDWGPNGFLDREPLTLQLCNELNLEGQLERANDNVNNRFILRNGRLSPVPMSPPKFMMSDILSIKGKARLLVEPFIKRITSDDDESIYDFGCRRIGREAADYLIQPMVSGIYGGLAERLSLKACFPIMRDMEAEYGSLFKAMIAKARKAKAEGKKSGGPAGPGGWLTSFQGGLSTLVDRCHELYSEQIRLDSAVTLVNKSGRMFEVTLADGSVERAEHLFLALPTYVASKMVSSLSPKLSDAFARIEYAPISVICTGFSRDDIKRNLNGFGFLVPKKEQRRILGSIWTSSIFSNRAPEGKVQFRSMVGGDGDHQSIKLSDEELLKTVLKDLNSIIGISGEPEIVKVYRWREGIPQFKIGHTEIINEIESALREIGNIDVTGNSYYGIGLNDCVKQSYRIVTSLPA